MAVQRQILRNLLECKVLLPIQTLGRLLVVLSRYVRQPIIGEECGREIVDYIESIDDHQNYYQDLIDIYGKFLPISFNRVIYCFYRHSYNSFSDTIHCINLRLNYAVDEEIETILTWVNPCNIDATIIDGINLGNIYFYMSSQHVHPERVIYLISTFNFSASKFIRGMVIHGCNKQSPIPTSLFAAREIVMRLIQTKEIILTKDSLMFDTTKRLHDLWPNDDLGWYRNEVSDQKELICWNVWIQSLNLPDSNHMTT